MDRLFRSGKDAVLFQSSNPWTGADLPSLAAYTVNGRRLQDLSAQRVGLLGHRVHGKFSAFPIVEISAPGCPLADDRVALKQQVKEANDIVDVVGSYIALHRPAPRSRGCARFMTTTGHPWTSIRVGSVTVVGPAINTAMSSTLFKSSSISDFGKLWNPWHAEREFRLIL